jgi:aminotransferase
LLRDGIYESRRNFIFHEMGNMDGMPRALKGRSSLGFLFLPDADLLLEKVQVVVAPGIGFGKYGEGYVRAGLLTSEERIREAVQRIQSLSLF